MNTLQAYLEQMKAIFSGLSRTQKILYTGATLLLAGSLAYILYFTSRAEYVPLFTGLSQSDMGEVANSLKAKKISYQLSSNTIEVPKEQLYETRLALAAEGIPKGSGIGFEIFDQQKLGSTEFVQKVNYQRALQGELARTINEMNEVMESRVHLVLPEESLFQEDRKPPSAAVVLKLRPGSKLGDKQIQGIVHLVASTVRGLDEDKVSIMSTDGQVLYRKNAGEQGVQMTNLQLERKNRMEEDLRQKLQSLLEQVLGSNRVLSRVTMDLDFNQVRIAEETYDPDSTVIRSQQRSTENTDGKEGGAKGNPDVPINVESKLLQSQPQGEGGKSKQFNRQREVVNYEINKVSKQIVQSPGNIKKLSVAVMVDGPYEMKPDADGKTKSVFVGRTPAEIKSLEEVVKRTIGYNEARGDLITVTNIPFATDSAGGEMVKAENKYVQIFKSYQSLLLKILVIGLIFFLVVRPLTRRLQKLAEEAKAQPEQLQALPEGSGQQLGLPDPTAEGQMPLRKRAAIMVQQDPVRAAEIVRAWLREES